MVISYAEYTYFASATSLSGSHRAFPDAFVLFLAFSVFCLLAFAGKGTDVLFGAKAGGASSPPSSSTHCTRYVFRICENTCSTSPAARIFAILRPPPAFVLDSIFFDLGSNGAGAVTSKSASRACVLAAWISAEAESAGTLADVGNSCSPASKPGYTPHYQLQRRSEK